MSSSTDGLQGASHAYAPSTASADALSPADLSGLSPAGLLNYASRSTSILDDQISATTEKMYDDLAQSQAISEDLERLGGIATHLLGITTDQNKKSTIERADLERLGALAYADEFGLDPAADSWDLSPAIVDKVSSQYEQRQSRINSHQERKMLALQEAMRQRSQVTQIVSNILRERGETMSQLVRNLA